MKLSLVIAMGFFSFLFGSRSQAQPPASKMNPVDVGRVLRQMMLTTPPQKTLTKPSAEFARIYGILMDWPLAEHIATIFAASSGDASVYTTSTFGIIGGQGHETVRNAAMKFVRAADGYFDNSKPTADYPYPAAGHVRFYFLTFTGVCVIEADLASIETGASKYRELFTLGQDVLTQLRVVAEKHH